MSLDERGRRAIEELVKKWTEKYLYHITFLEKQGTELHFMVEFSLPTPEKPIPISTVQVYFFVRDVGSGAVDLRYRFEKDSLVHTPGKSIRDTQMEQWIETFLLKKSLTRQNVFYLGSQYELTRVKDPRQDRILEKKVEQEEPEYVYIAPELLFDQRRSIDIMESKTLTQDYHKLVRKFFRTVDKDNLGVVTIEEFVQILKNMNLRLTAQEIADLTSRVDPTRSGMVEFKDYQAIAEEIVKSFIAKDQAIGLIKSNEQEYELESIMMLINEGTHQIGQKMLEKFRKLDEDEHGYVKLSDVKHVLEEINAESLEPTEEQLAAEQAKLEKQERHEKKAPPVEKQNTKSKRKKRQPKQASRKEPLLSVIEISDFTRRLSEKYEFNQVKYDGLQKQLLDFKLENLKKGLVESNLNNLEVYLRELFDPYDKDKFGRIHLNDMMLAFQKSDKIVLTKGQRYVLKSIVDRDEKDIVSYINSSKQIAELLKRFYLTSDRRRN